jgi:hypothetical protein
VTPLRFDVAPHLTHQDKLKDHESFKETKLSALRRLGVRAPKALTPSAKIYRKSMARAMIAEHYPCAAPCLKRNSEKWGRLFTKSVLGKPASKFTVSRSTTINRSGPSYLVQCDRVVVTGFKSVYWNGMQEGRSRSSTDATYRCGCYDANSVPLILALIARLRASIARAIQYCTVLDYMG